MSLEIERKYIIELPDLDSLRKYPGYRMSSITQIYLSAPEGRTHRVRRRVTDGHAVYTETKKQRLSATTSEEQEREITAEEFDRLAASQAKASRPVIKQRHIFNYDGQLFEIDVYPRWRSTAIMETELDSPKREVKMPPEIKIIREVTGQMRYSNAAMSRRFPEEITCDSASPQE